MKKFPILASPLRVAALSEWPDTGTAVLNDDSGHGACVQVVVGMEAGPDSFGRVSYIEDGRCVARLNQLLAGYNTFAVTGAVLHAARTYILENGSDRDMAPLIERIDALLLQRAGDYITPGRS